MAPVFELLAALMVLGTLGATPDVPPTVSASGYPPALRDRVFTVTAPPTFERNADGTATWLRCGEGCMILWDWPNRLNDAPERQQRPTLASVLQLDPNVEYTFDVAWVTDCDDLVIDYPFRADRALLLQVRRGDAVLFDALQEACRRTGKPVAELVRIAIPPTPAVAATVAPTGGGTGIGGVLLQLLETKAFCESEAAFRARWREQEQELGAGSEGAGTPLILVQQPQWENRVVVFVYDTTARGRDAIEIAVLEAGCPDYYDEPGRTMRLPALEYHGPLFVGTAEIKGAHGTSVKVRYRRPGDGQRDQDYESAPVYMTFH